MQSDQLLPWLRELYEAVPEEEYPETHQALAYAAAMEFQLYDQDPMDYVMDFNRSDSEKPLQEEVAEFVREVCEEEIETGSASAAYLLGALYYSGRIGEQDFSKAIELYQFAEERGDPYAAEGLGYCYRYGRSVPVDYERAFHYFSKGAFSGWVVSLFNIGDMYRYGYYVDQNEAEAFSIYNRCLELLKARSDAENLPDVFMRLGDCFAEGIGTEPDYEKALGYYQGAAYGFRQMIKRGDFMLKENYWHCVDQETVLREALEESFPQWAGF